MRDIVATPMNQLPGKFNVKTGVIGLGAMGSGMALNLHKAGHLHSIWNRTASKAEKKVPLVEQTIADYEKLMEQGLGDEDISSLYRLKRHS
jgi:3-hydroxyisobutyrate dehydrogenase